MDRKTHEALYAGLVLLLALAAPSQDDTDYRRYLPLEPGNSWTFKGSDDQTYTLKVKNKTRYQKNDVYVVKLDGGSVVEEEYLTVEEVGIKLWKYSETKGSTTTEWPYPDPLLKATFPPQAGKKWDIKMTDGKKIFVRTTEILAEEDLQVPAGKFKALPVKVTVSCENKPLSEITTWYALDVGIVKRLSAAGDKKKTLELDKYNVKPPKEVKRPPVDPQTVRQEISAELIRLVDESTKKEDYELAQFFAELHLGIIGDATKQAAEDAKKKILDEHTKQTAVNEADLAKLAETAKSLREKFAPLVVGQDKLKLSVHVMMLKTMHEHARAIKLFNQYRQNAKLPPCAWSFAFSYRCTLHSRYLALNGYQTFKTPEEYHSEDPKNPYFTDDGRTASGRSDVASIPISKAVKAWLDTLYHRIPMLSPSLRIFGTGMWDESIDSTQPSCLDLYSGADQLPAEQPVFVVFPAADQTGVDSQFSAMGELPKPVPGTDEKKLGYPITLSFYTRHSITKAQAKLTLDGKEVACHVSTPENPTNKEAGAFSSTLCLIPKEFLKPQSKYTAGVSCELDGKPFTHTWSFTTR